MIRIIENLIFQADGRTDRGRLAGLFVNRRNARLHKDLDAAVAAGGDLEIGGQFEIGIALARDNVAAGLRLRVAAGDHREHTILDHPSFWSETDPTSDCRQPSVVWPSQSRVQPSAFSLSVSVFGAASARLQQVEHEVVSARHEPKHHGDRHGGVKRNFEFHFFGWWMRMDLIHDNYSDADMANMVS